MPVFLPICMSLDHFYSHSFFFFFLIVFFILINLSLNLMALV